MYLYKPVYESLPKIYVIAGTATLYIVPLAWLSAGLFFVTAYVIKKQRHDYRTMIRL